MSSQLRMTLTALLFLFTAMGYVALFASEREPGILSITNRDLQETNASHWRSPAACGVGCAYILLKMKGYNPDYQDVASAIPIRSTSPDDPLKGSSLYDIQMGCRQLGLDADVIRAKPSDFDAIRWPGVAHVANPMKRPDGSEEYVGHYIVVLRVENHRIFFIDPTSPDPASVTRGDFFRSWSGYLLVPKGARAGTGWRTGPTVTACASLLLMFVGLVMVFSKLASRVRRKAFRSVTVTMLLLMACLVQAGCGDSEDAFSLTAWSTDADLGVLPEGGKSSAEFLIENTGTVEVRLEAGQPSCTCASMSLDKPTLASGETARLEMALNGERGRGLVEAAVDVAAIGQKWAYTFRVKGVALGWELPNTTIVLRNPEGVVNVLATVYLRHADDPVDLRASFADKEFEDLVKISTVRFSEATPVASCYKREAVFTLEPLAEEFVKLTEARSTRLEITTTPPMKDGNHGILLVQVPTQTTGGQASLAE